MTQIVAQPADVATPFELKGSAFTLTVMHLQRHDLEAIGTELDLKVRQAPGFFKNTPVVLDLEGLSDSVTEGFFGELMALLRDRGMVPVGIRGGLEEHRGAAVAAGLAVLPSSGGRGRVRAPAAEPEVSETISEEPDKAPEPVPEQDPPEPESSNSGPGGQASPVGSNTVVVSTPVRSGQQIYSEHGDLIALKTVSAGAELVASGNVHVLGPLRGRALAGAHGDVNAHIICQGLQAELVSIAGRYRVFEELDPGVRGRAVHIYLAGERLIIEPL